MITREIRGDMTSKKSVLGFTPDPNEPFFSGSRAQFSHPKTDFSRRGVYNVMGKK